MPTLCLQIVSIVIMLGAVYRRDTGNFDSFTGESTYVSSVHMIVPYGELMVRGISVRMLQ